jgi:hypothetical protein
MLADSGPRIMVLDATRLLAVVFPRDSLLSILWRRTEIEVATSRGYEATVRLHPPACLIPVAGEAHFPYTFEWFFCDMVAFQTTSVLSPSRFNAIAQLASGDTVLSIIFGRSLVPYYPAEVVATYVMRVPFGLSATSAARRRVGAQPEVYSTSWEIAQPPCMRELSPVCPPWFASGALPISFSDAPGADSIPVARGGWLRVSYRQPDGSVRSAEFLFLP